MNGMSWIEEALAVVLISTRTQMALILGMVSCTSVLGYAWFAIHSFKLIGPLAPLTDVIKLYLAQRYEIAAFGSLCGFFMLAVKYNIRDYQRLTGGD